MNRVTQIINIVAVCMVFASEPLLLFNDNGLLIILSMSTICFISNVISIIVDSINRNNNKASIFGVLGSMTFCVSNIFIFTKTWIPVLILAAFFLSCSAVYFSQSKKFD